MSFSCGSVAGVDITRTECVCWLFSEGGFTYVFLVWLVVTCFKFLWSSDYKLQCLMLVLCRVDCQCCLIFPCANITERDFGYFCDEASSFGELLKLGGREGVPWVRGKAGAEELQTAMDVVWFMAYLQGQQWRNSEKIQPQCRNRINAR